MVAFEVYPKPGLTSIYCSEMFVWPGGNMEILYDTIGGGYAELRLPDPGIEKAIRQALGNVATIVNVGAGCGSYEPTDKAVVAVELSTTMIAQRPAGSAPVVQASAMALPFKNKSFDAALAILTVHHWQDRKRGLRELLRVARQRVVILTWDPAFRGFWLDRYVPQILEQDRSLFPSIPQFRDVFDAVDVIDVPVPHDCTDGFLCAYWRRPEAYLDARVRAAISTFTKLGDIRPALQLLKRDLESGKWQRRHADLLQQTELDLGYRLIVANPTQ